MTTAVAGYSHAIAIRDALRATPTNALGACEFYLMNANWEVDEIVERGRQRARLLRVPRADAGDSGLLLDRFDNLLISALGCGAARNSFAVPEDGALRHPLGAMACADWGYAADRVPRHVRLTSLAVFRATVAAWARGYHMTQLLRRVALAYRGRIFVQPWPAPNRALKHDGDWFPNQWYGQRGPRAWQCYFEAQRAAIVAIVGELGPRVVLLDYPDPSTRDDGFMDPGLCDGSDPFHGNERYGALVAEQVAALL